MKLIKREDRAHELLLPFIKETEYLLIDTLKKLDSTAMCRITPAVDLGFPHDVIRIAGGFATGILVEWKCDVPFIPIDTTVNIDTSTIFYLDDDISDKVDECDFNNLREKFEESSYVFNFHKGNHFISFGRSLTNGTPVLIIHSNEKEFKYQYNGLMPVKSNWYGSDICINRKGNRYIRYIKGDKAELFQDMAKMLEEFNIIRHRFVANILTNGKTKILEQVDKHHYYMPNRNSVAIGCFLASEDENVPIFSKVGKDIFIFSPHKGGRNKINTLEGNSERLIVPHGWGKTTLNGLDFEIDLDKNCFNLSGVNYKIEPLISLGKDNRLVIRDFSSDPNEENSLFEQMKDVCPGNITDRIRQICSFSKHGFMRHI